MAKHNYSWPSFLKIGQFHGQIVKNGQTEFAMARGVEKWPILLNLAMKWPIWQPCN